MTIGNAFFIAYYTHFTTDFTQFCIVNHFLPFSPNCLVYTIEWTIFIYIRVYSCSFFPLLCMLSCLISISIKIILDFVVVVVGMCYFGCFLLLLVYLFLPRGGLYVIYIRGSVCVCSSNSIDFVRFVYNDVDIDGRPRTIFFIILWFSFRRW